MHRTTQRRARPAAGVALARVAAAARSAGESAREASRPVSVRYAEVLAERWAALPASARTPAQLLGRHAVGCEGTHGVFPRCNLTCKPCYHSADANKVRVDGEHTLREVEAQMAHFAAVRGPRGHAQLIGGEVSLLTPDDHAETLLTMRRHGREPMSMTHGDFDEQYLRDLVLGPDGRPRLKRVSFAGHFDSLMRGRTGLPRPRSEAEVTPFRHRFTEMFARLEAEHGVSSYLAHNMTVTPSNLDQVPGVVRDGLAAKFDMLSFQPAAFVGDERRWAEELREIDSDDVWARIEAGFGTRLPFRALQMGDERCNRTAWGWLVAGRFVPVLDDLDGRDLAVRDAFLRSLGGVQVSGVPASLLALKLLRVVFGNLGALPLALGWARRAVARSGGPLALLRGPVRPLSVVMHVFMDAADVRPAWEAMERGEVATDPRVRATQERLQACSYAMAHPEDDRVVPACVQHGVLDQVENAGLRRLLPIAGVTTASC